jgi:multidrug efflux pump
VTLSDIAVRRPVFAVVVAMILTLIGVVSFFQLPLRELPMVDPPQVTVQTNYIGASAEVIETRITQPLERQLAGIQGIDRMNSSSRDGRSNINITFTLDRGVEDAANDVRDRVSRVLSQLPQDAQSPQISKADADQQPIVFLTLSSTKLDRIALGDYADRYLVTRLSTIPGVARINLLGAQLYAMRVWVDSQALAARNLTTADIENALRSQNVEVPAGSLEAEDKDYTINVQRNYRKAADFAQLPIAVGAGGYVVRLGDVARVEEGADDRRRTFRTNGVEKVGLGVIRQSQSNDIAIANGVLKLVDEMQASMPEGMKLELGADQTGFTREAVKEVYITIGLSIALVAIVNLLFLGSWRSAIIPTIVAPICVLCTFSVLAALGFSLNLLTLLALVLAIGLVVDDAIVVVENIQRRVDMGEPRVVAAQRGAKQVFFAVVATTMVLLAVFAPLMFLPGYTGRLFVELAVAVAGAVAFSAFFALTLSPMLASKLLKPAHDRGRLARIVDNTVDLIRRSYHNSLQGLLGRPSVRVVTIALVLVIAGAAAGLFSVLPNELAPEEDRGRVNTNYQAPEGSGFDYTLRNGLQAEAIYEKHRKEGTVAGYTVIIPGNNSVSYNSGFGFINMAPWHERKISTQAFAAQLNRELGQLTGIRVNANQQSGFQRGGGGSTSVDLIIGGPEYEEVAKWAEPILTAARANPGLTRVNMDYEPDSPRLIVSVDKDRAGQLGVSANEIGDALNVMFGPKRVTTYVREGQEYDVLLQTELQHRRTLQDLETVYVKGRSGELVPLSNVVKTELIGSLANRQRVDQLRAITITSTLNPGYTVGEAVKFFQDEVKKQPAGPVIRWGGQAKDYLDSGNAVGVAFGFALLIVFLVLAAQFESFIHPAVIMLTVPLAACGGLFGLFMAGSTLNLYSQIGLVILIGIAAKNGILIVEFANQLRDEGRSVREAVIEAAELRLRPILMTSIATTVGSMPLVFWQGPGSGSRFTIGVVIACGAIFATLLTLFVVPVMYELLAKYTKSPEHTARTIDAYDEEEARREAKSPPPRHPPGLPEAAE